MTPRVPTPEKRLELIERDLRDHAKSLSTHTTRLIDVEKEIVAAEAKITAIEDARRDRQIDDARWEEREIARKKEIDDRFDRIESQLKDIKAIGSRVVWIVVGAVLLAIVTFALKGGFILK